MVDQIPLVNGVDLHAVKARPLGIVGALTEALHDGMDLIHGQRPTCLIQPAVRNGGRGHRWEFAQIRGNGDAAKAAGHLKKDLAAVGVDPFGHLTGGSDEMDGIVCAVGAVGHGLHLHRAVREGHAGDDQARAAFRALRIK